MIAQYKLVYANGNTQHDEYRPDYGLSEKMYALFKEYDIREYHGGIAPFDHD